VSSDTASQFGTFAPSSSEAIIRRFTHQLPYNYIGRKLASLFLRAAGGRDKHPRDVTIFGSERARLHPYDNICEKRVFITPDHWDPIERKLFAQIISVNNSRPFIFIDIGANAGLYSLFGRSIARMHKIPFKAFCIEPDQTMIARLQFNIKASRAENDFTIIEKAVANINGTLSFTSNEHSRGLSKLDKEGSLQVSCTTLLTIINDQKLSHIDAIKIDIEGKEYPALKAFFDEANQAVWPRLIIIETSHEESENSASLLVAQMGYTLVKRTKMNGIYISPKEKQEDSNIYL